MFEAPPPLPPSQTVIVTATTTTAAAAAAAATDDVVIALFNNICIQNSKCERVNDDRTVSNSLILIIHWDLGLGFIHRFLLLFLFITDLAIFRLLVFGFSLFICNYARKIRENRSRASAKLVGRIAILVVFG